MSLQLPEISIGNSLNHTSLEFLNAQYEEAESKLLADFPPNGIHLDPTALRDRMEELLHSLQTSYPGKNHFIGTHQVVQIFDYDPNADTFHLGFLRRPVKNPSVGIIRREMEHISVNSRNQLVLRSRRTPPEHPRTIPLSSNTIYPDHPSSARFLGRLTLLTLAQ